MTAPTDRPTMTVRCYGEIDQDAPGPEFFDESTGRDAKLIIDGKHTGWLVFWGESDRWLPWRPATLNDLQRIQDVMFDRVLERLS